MKKVLSLLFSGVITFSLCACGQGNSDVYKRQAYPRFNRKRDVSDLHRHAPLIQSIPLHRARAENGKRSRASAVWPYPFLFFRMYLALLRSARSVQRATAASTRRYPYTGGSGRADAPAAATGPHLRHPAAKMCIRDRLYSILKSAPARSLRVEALFRVIMWSYAASCSFCAARYPSATTTEPAELPSTMTAMDSHACPLSHTPASE